VGRWSLVFAEGSEDIDDFRKVGGIGGDGEKRAVAIGRRGAEDDEIIVIGHKPEREIINDRAGGDGLVEGGDGRNVKAEAAAVKAGIVDDNVKTGESGGLLEIKSRGGDVGRIKVTIAAEAAAVVFTEINTKAVGTESGEKMVFTKGHGGVDSAPATREIKRNIEGDGGESNEVTMSGKGIPAVIAERGIGTAVGIGEVGGVS
jgi:hypothetical protein